MRPDGSRVEVGVEPFEEVVKSIVSGNQKKSIAIDLETTGLNVYESRVTWLSWCIGQRYGAVPIRHRNLKFKDNTIKITNANPSHVADLIQQLHRNKNAFVIYHNGKFDISMMVAGKWLSLDDISDDRIFDTMLASHTINPVKSREMGGGCHGLKTLYNELLRDYTTDGPQPDYYSVSGGRSFEDVYVDEASWYAAFDAWTTYHIQEPLEKVIRYNPALNHYFYKIELPHLLSTIEMVVTGMMLKPQTDVREGWRIEHLEQRFEQLLQEIFMICRRSFKFSSPDALRQALFYGNAGLIPKGRGKDSKKYLIDKNTLISIYEATDDSWKRLLLATTLYAKYLDTTIKKHREMYNAINRKTGKIHPNLRPTTASGRYSCPTPNVLSLSSSSKIKEHIIPSDSDRAFVVADFSQIDLRVIANEAAEMNPNSRMYKDVNSGRDLHFNTVTIIDDRAHEKMNQKDWFKIGKDGEVKDSKGNQLGLSSQEQALAKDLRKVRDGIAKQVNFGVSYGLGPNNLMTSLNNDDKALDELIDNRGDSVLDVQTGEEKVTMSSLEPDWFKGMQNFYESQDVITKDSWTRMITNQLMSDAKISDWLTNVDSKLKSAGDKVDLDKVKEYFGRFHESYPDIASFQERIKDDLERSGYTWNLFGRRCRAEIATHLSGDPFGKHPIPNKASSAWVDVKVTNEKWFRVKFIKLGMDKQNLDCIVQRVISLQVKEPSKYNVKIKDIELIEEEVLYELDLLELVSLIFEFRCQSQDLEWVCERLLQLNLGLDIDQLNATLNSRKRDISIQDLYDGFLRIHDKGFFDAHDFFDAIKPALPRDVIIDPDEPEFAGIDIPMFPFASIPHIMIKKVIVEFPKTKAHLSYIGHDKLRRNLISSRVSSTSMDFCKIAMFEFRREAAKKWPQENERPRIINCIHDEIAVECLKEQSQEVKELLEYCMTFDPRNPNRGPFGRYVFGKRKLLTAITAEAEISDENYAKAKP